MQLRMIALLAAGCAAMVTGHAGAQCVSRKCADTALIATARARIAAVCGCTRAEQQARAHTRCVTRTLKTAELRTLVPRKACRMLITQCETQSVCGRPGKAICCKPGKRGMLVPARNRCRGGTLCGNVPGLDSVFDACGPDGTCATLPPTSTTSPPSTTTTSSTTSTTSSSSTTTTSSTTSTTSSSSTTTSLPSTTTSSTSTTSTTLVPLITTVAGGDTGDGGPATRAQLIDPFGVAPLADGGFLIADASNNRVRRVAADGTITTVAGTGTAGFSGDDGPATAAQLNFPGGVAPLAGGGFLIADTSNNRVRHVAADGTITTVAGGGTGDGGPATRAQLLGPFGVAPLAGGGFLIADTDNHRVRHVAPDGTIATFAGGGTAGLGDGGPAFLAQLNFPFGVAPLADGGFLIADTGNERVRRVLADGTITTVAGGGSAHPGDGGPASMALLLSPFGVAPLADGGFLFADASDHRVRRVAADGTITTVAGTGTRGFSGDDGPATAAQVDFPTGVAPLADGGFLIADQQNNRVRHVAADGTITTVAGTGTSGFSGEGGPAIAAQLAGPSGVAPAGGGFLIADSDNNRIRLVSPFPP
jgi:hypothetical protein